MPNRIIKESIRTSDTLADVSADAERLFWRIVVSVDDYGRFDGRPNVIVGQCLSSFLGRVTINQVEKWLKELQSADLLQMYEFDGKPYLMLTKWSKHQRTRAKDSKFPSPDDACSHPLSSDSNRDQAQSDVVSNVFVFENEIENEIKDHDRPSSDPKSKYPPDFEKWWAIYPRKDAKAEAAKAWKAALRKKVLVVELTTALSNYVADCQRKNTEREYIMHAATFIRGRYEDYLEAVPVSQVVEIDQARASPVTPYPTPLGLPPEVEEAKRRIEHRYR